MGYVVTVHKCQGGTYEDVVTIMPDGKTPVELRMGEGLILRGCDWLHLHNPRDLPCPSS
ncbi:hypothetical protein CcrJ4_gp450 [Caulobacter phage J4]|nr:hypothetical protein CcrJ4_gp450 [Caulobacter phage J4]UTU09761.1 hypothetical protein CcrBL47_gp477 [Caulobacter phage BL47]